MGLKLRQGQIWKCGDGYLRIVQLERLRVGFKRIANIHTGDGKHEQATKKEFCRMLKGCALYEPDSQVLAATPQTDLEALK